MSSMRERSLPIYREIKRAARALAENDFQRSPPKTRVSSSFAVNTTRNWYVSRQTARHYVTLLRNKVERSELERDVYVTEIQENAAHPSKTSRGVLEQGSRRCFA